MEGWEGMGGGADVEESQPDWTQEEEEVAPENDHGTHLDTRPKKVFPRYKHNLVDGPMGRNSCFGSHQNGQQVVGAAVEPVSVRHVDCRIRIRIRMRIRMRMRKRIRIEKRTLMPGGCLLEIVTAECVDG